ncbi:MAG: TRAM domain-containing protein [Verrucomicrobia bacterium]|nr:TRAM domain-containing protein [Verrucomicrobiota bacterium]
MHSAPGSGSLLPMQDPVPSGPPFQAGQRHVLRIATSPSAARGVGRLGEFVVFVPFTLVDEEVEVELTEVKRHFARGRLLAVRQASPSRVPPAAPTSANAAVASTSM